MNVKTWFSKPFIFSHVVVRMSRLNLNTSYMSYITASSCSKLQRKVIRKRKAT